MRSAALARARTASVRAPGRGPIGYVHAFFRLLLDPRLGIGSKLLVLLAVVYVFMPVDLVPDVIPVVGWLDDLGFVTVALGFLARAVGKYRQERNDELLTTG